MNLGTPRPVSCFFPIGGNVETGGNETGNETVSPSETMETEGLKTGNARPKKTPLPVSTRFHLTT